MNPEFERVRGSLLAQGAKLAPEEIIARVEAAMTDLRMADAQRLWLQNRREKAAAPVPDELILKTNLLGTDAMVRDLVRAL